MRYVPLTCADMYSGVETLPLLRASVEEFAALCNLPADTVDVRRLKELSHKITECRKPFERAGIIPDYTEWLQYTVNRQYMPEEADKAHISITWADPSTFSYEVTAYQKTTPEYFGAFTMDPRLVLCPFAEFPKTQVLSRSIGKFLLEIPEAQKTHLWQIIEYVFKNYGDTYFFPGLEFAQYITRDDGPEYLKLLSESQYEAVLGNEVLCLGSLFCDKEGKWTVPTFQIAPSGKWIWGRATLTEGKGLIDKYRIIMLRKNPPVRD